MAPHSNAPRSDDPQDSGGDWVARNLGSTAASGNAEPQQMPDDPERQNVRERDEAERRGQAPQQQEVNDPARPASADQEDEQARYGRDETRRNPNLDPEAHGGRSGAGESTPPASQSATATPPAQAPDQPPKSRIWIIAIAAVIGVVLLLFLLGGVFGWFG